jgi:parallel beta helix pectate lyase-like protein
MVLQRLFQNPPSIPLKTSFSPPFRLLALFSLLLPGTASAATEVCGTLSLATEWVAKESPYLVTGDIFIPANSRLRIGPGVIVRFAKPRPCADAKGPIPQTDWSDSTYTGIKAEGTFYTLGTEEQPVLMEPETFKTGAIGWDGVRLSGHRAGAAEIGFTVFRGANQAVTADHGEFFIHHSLFEGNNTGVLAGMRGDVGIVNCNFTGNLSAGVVIRKGSPRIANNIFLGNRSYGIWGDGRPAIRTWNNAFWGNREEACFKCPYAVLDTVRTNSNKDACDRFGNLAADPMFIGSPSWKAAEEVDEETATPAHLIKDPAMAKLEADATAKRDREAKEKEAEAPTGGKGKGKDRDGKKKAKPFVQQGIGPFLLSKYSKLVDAGHPGGDFKDRDGSRNDIGMHGGPMGRIASDPF